MRTQTIVQTIEKVIPFVDGTTAIQLREAQMEVERLRDDLRDANGKLSLIEERATAAERQAGELRLWGVQQAQESADNFTEAQKQKERADVAEGRNKQLGKDKRFWVFAFCGLVSLVVVFFIARQYFPFLKLL